MPRYSDSRSSVLESDSEYLSRESRGRHRSRGAAILDRPPRRVEDEFRWDARLQETDRFGPPARRPSRHYEDDHLHHSGPLIRHERRHAESPPPRPRMLRRQSSLDTYDRLPSRKIDEYYHGYLPRGAPSPPPARRRVRRDEYEAIRIPERESRYRERVEEVKSYPRKGKTRMPRKLVHTRAIREYGYPYEEEDDLVIIQLALSKEQIDAVIERSREIKRQAEAIPIRARSPVRATSRHRRVERVAMETFTPSPRASETLIVEPASDRYLSPSPAGYDYSTKTTRRTVSRSRSISIAPRTRTRRHSSPVRMLVAPRDERSDNPGQLAMVIRPRDSDSSLDDYAIDHYRPPFDPETALYGPSGEEEEVLEIKKDRRGPPSRTLRRMLATMT
ncbi:hypothetical protein ASPCAL01036 [Aspergillus calidoustus]|uniref:DUF8035 domain-containing protein n=1 Tax=Aspergillus calidoustus TaxID=454130 RepID=A0A0U5FT59_ASPCI|nr:hypothetical protein ASPCAL01036 [Aspergillus calidoustus]